MFALEYKQLHIVKEPSLCAKTALASLTAGSSMPCAMIASPSKTSSTSNRARMNGALKNIQTEEATHHGYYYT